jgi:hypothetical protein
MKLFGRARKDRPSNCKDLDEILAVIDLAECNRLKPKRLIVSANVFNQICCEWMMIFDKGTNKPMIAGVPIDTIRDITLECELPKRKGK